MGRKVTTISNPKQITLLIEPSSADKASELTRTPQEKPEVPHRLMMWAEDYDDGCRACLEVLPPEEDGHPCFTSMTLYEPTEDGILSEVGCDDGESPWRVFQVKRGDIWYELSVEIG